MPTQTNFAATTSRKEQGVAQVANNLSVNPKAPITAQRPVPADLEKIISKPNVPRASGAPSVEFPKGADDAKDVGTPMMQHVEFFDRNKDGNITPYETYLGMRAIGFNVIFSIMAMIIINSAFSYYSQDTYLPDPFFGIKVKNVHKGKHCSDQMVYDNEGRFIPQRMEEIFTKFDSEKKGYLTGKDVLRATESVRNVNDPFGWFAGKFEWGTLWLLCQENGKISREDVRSCYDGTLFYRIEKKRNAAAAAKRQAHNNHQHSQ